MPLSTAGEIVDFYRKASEKRSQDSDDPPILEQVVEMVEGMENLVHSLGDSIEDLRLQLKAMAKQFEEIQRKNDIQKNNPQMCRKCYSLREQLSDLLLLGPSLSSKEEVLERLSDIVGETYSDNSENNHNFLRSPSKEEDRWNSGKNFEIDPQRKESFNSRDPSAIYNMHESPNLLSPEIGSKFERFAGRVMKGGVLGDCRDDPLISPMAIVKKSGGINEFNQHFRGVRTSEKKIKSSGIQNPSPDCSDSSYLEDIFNCDEGVLDNKKMSAKRMFSNGKNNTVLVARTKPISTKKLPSNNILGQDPEQNLEWLMDNLPVSRLMGRSASAELTVPEEILSNHEDSFRNQAKDHSDIWRVPSFANLMSPTPQSKNSGSQKKTFTLKESRESKNSRNLLAPPTEEFPSKPENSILKR